ncbi:hypothetical protein GYH30_047291 [Glycine max]|nr:hypothetical protein GYH30_047291 [Glycine max]
MKSVKCHNPLQSKHRLMAEFLITYHIYLERSINENN